MKISFNIHFPTVWGQTLHIIGSIPELGDWNIQQALSLQYVTDSVWSGNIEVPNDCKLIEYSYCLKSNGKVIFEPWDRKHQAYFNVSGCSQYLLHDVWQEKPNQIAFYSTAFTEVLFKPQHHTISKKHQGKRNIRIKVFAPNIEKHRNLALCGNQPVLGNWDSGKALKMTSENFPEWEVDFDASNLSYPIEYKFIIYSNNDSSIEWETGDNRVLRLPFLKEGETSIISGLTFRRESPAWKGAGMAIPVFSLRSKDSFGIGDFHDLKKMVDWVKLTGQKIIQILPVNDTTMSHTWMDSYPYNAISIYALHPLYLNLRKMGTLNDTALELRFKEKQDALNALEKVDYEQVEQYKWEFFKALFDQEGMDVLSSDGFKYFFDENNSWLVPYAAYSYLREKFKTSDFNYWEDYARYDEHKILSLCKPQSKWYQEIAIYYYLQYQLHVQLKEAKDYADSQAIILKGDIPIGISSTSIEAWTEPQFFNMNAQAGAPPDDFSVTGQNWGFPTYKWEEMEKDGYAWWKRRFQHISRYFSAYRIDHILGFFRIWEVPKHSVEALYACFNPALPLTLEEIQDTGLQFEEEKFVRPQVNGCFLSELFGTYAQEASDIYMVRLSECYFALREEFDTQQKIKAHFAGKDDFKNEAIRKALFVLANEVLFIPDKERADCYHPTISAHKTFAYRELSQSDRYAFDYLHWHYFYHKQNDFWKEQAYKKLIPLTSCTKMMVCGEDLGMIPACVPEVMNELQIFSLEIERMPKQENLEFEELNKIPYRAICTTSTHDMSTIRGWWEEDYEKTQRYFNQILKREGEAPQSCSPDICQQIIENHLNSPAMWVVVPLQDWLGMDKKTQRENASDERINIPANPRHYWGYRMHMNIEDLLREKKLNQLIKDIIEETGRD